jgi:hypothetical protein
MAKPFARSIALFALLASIKGKGLLPNALDPAFAYKSRGKGKGLHSGKKWGPHPSYQRDMVQHANGLWYQKENGAREVARRLRQAERNARNVQLQGA